MNACAEKVGGWGSTQLNFYPKYLPVFPKILRRKKEGVAFQQQETSGKGAEVERTPRVSTLCLCDKQDWSPPSSCRMNPEVRVDDGRQLWAMLPSLLIWVSRLHFPVTPHSLEALFISYTKWVQHQLRARAMQKNRPPVL